ncbi:MAG: hypothetical protein HKK66_03545 [Chlorobiaceae bacterium]|nr:hypothetical protein [Chlorobiaceae bacterium]
MTINTSSSTVTSDYIKAGLKSIRFAPEETLDPWLIYGGEESYTRSGVNVIGWRDLAHKADCSAG